MPNHVTNRITTAAGKLEDYIGEEKSEVTGETVRFFDFNLIIPQPEIIKKYESISGDVKTAAEIALGLIDFDSDQSDLFKFFRTRNATEQLVKGRMPKDFNDREFEQFQDYIQAWKETGSYMNWYDWNRANWGTKWNGYSFKELDNTTIVFETAWNAPHPVIHELQRQIRCPLIHEWADEDTGHNVGMKSYASNGHLIVDEEYSKTKRGYELAFDLCGGSEYYCWDGEKYIYIEEED